MLRYRLSALFMVIAISAVIVRAYQIHQMYSQPVDWTPYSDRYVTSELEKGRNVLIYCRADWWVGSDRLEKQLFESGLVKYQINSRRLSTVILNHSNTENGNLKYRSMSFAPSIEIYCPNIDDKPIAFKINSDLSPELLADRIKRSFVR